MTVRACKSAKDELTEIIRQTLKKRQIGKYKLGL